MRSLIASVVFSFAWYVAELGFLVNPICFPEFFHTWAGFTFLIAISYPGPFGIWPTHHLSVSDTKQWGILLRQL